MEHSPKQSANTTFLIVKDHAVSQEDFQLIYRSDLDMLETYPQPTKDNLSKYYRSEDYISHTDARRNLFEKVYQLIRKFTLKKKLNLINSLKTESKELLDIGCGTGDFLKIAETNGWNVTGIEPNSSAREIANNKTNNAVYNSDTLNQLSEESFDIITLWHVLEHLPDLDQQIKLLNKLLKPNGKLIIAVPNYKSFDANFYKDFWAAYDAPRHLWHFSQESIQRLFEIESMSVKHILPMKFDAYYVCLLSEKFKSGWMNIFSAFFIATRSNLKAQRSGEYSSLTYVLEKG